MGRRKDDIRTFIVIISICAICVVLALILSIKSNVDRLDYVSEYNVFFTNVNYVNSYINYISSNNAEGVYSLLDKKYIEDNGITYDNVLDKLDSYTIGSNFSATSMDFVQINDNFIYYVKGKVYEIGYNSERLVDEDFSIIIINDYNNLSFSLYPVDNDNYEDKLNSIKKINVESNEYNMITKSELISKEQVCVIYLSDFFGNLGRDIDESYELLSDDMKKIYTTSDSLKTYVDNNISRFSTSADKCKMEKIDDKRVYTVIDANSNTYVFTEDSIMNYKIDFYLKES